MDGDDNDGNYPREDALQRVVEAALENQDVAGKAMRQVQRSAGLLEDAARTVDAASRKIPEQVSAKVLETLHFRLREVEEASSLARNSLKNAARVGAAWFFVSGFLGVVAAIGIGAWIILPSYAELKDLYAEKAELERRVSELKRQYPRMEITVCDPGSIACVRTVERREEGPYKGRNGETYRIIYGAD